MEKLLVGDIEKYGPRGNKTFAFDLWEQIPEQYYGGLLAESWEIQTTPTVQFTFHLRKGVMFTGNQKIGFASRELTATDVVYSEERAKSRPGFAAGLAYLKSETAVDKYTVVWVMDPFNATWAWRFNGTALGQIWAKEVVDAGAADWRNQSGTGPYILTDFVSNNGATYTKNPNYWGKTTINGVAYQMPFIDKVIYPVIPDESTQIAAIRTGKIDWSPKVKLSYSATLTQSSPNMVQQKYLAGTVDYLKLNSLNGPNMTKLDLRRALWVATDLKSIPNLIYGGGEYFSWPYAPNIPTFTPFDQLSASEKEMWTYDPANAKKIMAAAGYPNGFTFTITVNSSNASNVDLANALVAMWAKSNITGVIQLLDNTAAGVSYDQVQYKDGIITSFTVVNPLTTMNLSRNSGAGSNMSLTDPATVLMEKNYIDLAGTVDPLQRTAKLKAQGLLYFDYASSIGFANPYVLNCYWPWFKNYYGELDASYYNTMPMIMRGWIDQSLKTKLGH
jgi:peptide/nickel transport system substrate-binding protein